MWAFDSRERAFENKFAHDCTIDFKIKARACKLIGLWAADKMQLKPVDKEIYALSLVDCGLALTTDGIVDKITFDMREAGFMDINTKEIRNVVEDIFGISRAQIMDAAA